MEPGPQRQKNPIPRRMEDNDQACLSAGRHTLPSLRCPHDPIQHGPQRNDRRPRTRPDRMPILQLGAPEEPGVIYSPALWLLLGALFGWLLCRAGVG